MRRSLSNNTITLPSCECGGSISVAAHMARDVHEDVPRCPYRYRQSHSEALFFFWSAGRSLDLNFTMPRVGCITSREKPHKRVHLTPRPHLSVLLNRTGSAFPNREAVCEDVFAPVAHRHPTHRRRNLVVNSFPMLYTGGSRVFPSPLSPSPTSSKLATSQDIGRWRLACEPAGPCCPLPRYRTFRD